MRKSDLKSRKRMVFDSIVNTYIEFGVPVGSVAVCNRYNLDLSPATIRNIMKEFEEIGYLTHPHTSAGRLPTDEGYRYYVDSVMEPENLTNIERDSILSIRDMKDNAPEALLEMASKILSDISNEVSLVLFPELKKNLLKQIKLVSLDDNRAVAILVTNSGQVETKNFEYSVEIDDIYLQKIAGFINENCANKPLSQAKDILNRLVFLTYDASYYMFRDALEIFERLDMANESDKLFLDGAHYLFGQPEFKNADKSKKLLEIFEEKKKLMQIIEESLVLFQQEKLPGVYGSSFDGVKIYIGKENKCQDVNECSIVISGYGIGGDMLGAIGIIGPTRMPYKRLVPIVSCIASEISNILETVNE